MKNEVSLKGKRNYGIDLLRIVSMLMVVILHILGQGGVLKSSQILSSQYEVACFLEMACYCAVNCYALISGYVGVDSKFKLSNIAYIWLQVIFYSVGIAALFAYFIPEVYINDVFEGFLPVTKNLYWYFTAYFCIFFFMPFFNKAIQNMSEKQLKYIGVCIFIIFSIMQTLAKREVFYTNCGYSALWLALLYVLGGIIKKTEFLSKVKNYWLALIYLLCIVITWVEKYVIDYLNQASPVEPERVGWLVSYISPTILISAIVLVVLFSKIKTGNVSAKLIAFFAPLSFGVYLIHVQKHIWIYVMKERFIWLAEYNATVIILAVLGYAVAIFLACIVIEFVRDLLFKLLKIKQSLQKIEAKIFGKILVKN